MSDLMDGGRPNRPFATLTGGEVSEWLMVPLSKSGVVTSHRGFESRPLRRAVEHRSAAFAVWKGRIAWPSAHDWKSCRR